MALIQALVVAAGFLIGIGLAGLALFPDARPYAALALLFALMALVLAAPLVLRRREGAGAADAPERPAARAPRRSATGSDAETVRGSPPAASARKGGDASGPVLRSVGVGRLRRGSSGSGGGVLRPAPEREGSDDRSASGGARAVLEVGVRLPQRTPVLWWLGRSDHRGAKASLGGSLAVLGALVSSLETRDDPLIGRSLFVPLGEELLGLARTPELLERLRAGLDGRAELVLVLEARAFRALAGDAGSRRRLTGSGEVSLAVTLEGRMGRDGAALAAAGARWLVVPARRLAAGEQLLPVDEELACLFRSFGEAGGRVLATGVRGERLLLDVLDYPVGYACGPHFGTWTPAADLPPAPAQRSRTA